jgi:subtilisin family serine protease
MPQFHLPVVRPARLVVVAAVLGAFFSTGLQASKPARRAHLSADLTRHQARRTLVRERVIVHGTDRELDLLASRHRLRIVKRMHGAAVVLANSAELNDLSLDVDQLSGDLPVQGSATTWAASTAAEQTQSGSVQLAGSLGIPGVDGRGIAVAVIDSGIAPHSALAQRVVANVSFVTDDDQTTDAYGHGTHVAGIIAGNQTAANGISEFAGGIAPGAKLVNVRVLGANGTGYTSDVIEGIEWVVANRARYNIRVINLSLGHPVMEACATDPLCVAVNQAVQAGIVVVVAAGNTGKAPNGRSVLGGISSPGNSPYAITVGALDTWGTVDRTDDTVAAFSSRGPSMYDLAVKPDVVAPGTKILSLQADGASLPAMYPSIHVAGSGNNAYMYLTGTSMSAPIVSGGVALLLQGSPNLSPAQVKFALQSGATAITDGGLMGAGAGSVNFWASRQIAVYGAAPALAQTAPSLGAAQTFAVLGASTVTNTGGSVVSGALGVSPGTAVTGFLPGLVVSGTMHSADVAASAAQDAVTTAYNSLIDQVCTRDMTGQDLGGQTLTAGVYCFSSSAQLTGNLTLNAQGNANAVFIFKMGSTLTTASASSVVMSNGGSPGNVFWQVGSSATLGTTTSFQGNILALASITVTTGSRVNGRTLARNGAVTLDTNAVTAPDLLGPAISTTVGGAQTTGSGVSFWDIGTLAARLEAGIATRVLSAADASLAWMNPSLLTFGDLNLLGLANPLGSLPPKSALYGAMAGWTADPSIAWGTPLHAPQGPAEQGDGIIWGTADQGDGIIWGTADQGDGIIWGTADQGDGIIWGTADHGDGIIWGTADHEVMRWAMAIMTSVDPRW